MNLGHAYDSALSSPLGATDIPRLVAPLGPRRAQWTATSGGAIGGAPSPTVEGPHAAAGTTAAQALAAAVVMSCVTSAGWETIARWPDWASTVVAPMRLANSRSASGGIAWSC